MTNSDVALLQRELHRLSDHMIALSDQVREYSDRVAQVEATGQGRTIADDEIKEFKDSVRRWIVTSVAGTASIITIALTLIDRL